MVNEKHVTIQNEPNVKHYDANDMVVSLPSSKKKSKSKKQLLFDEYKYDIFKPLKPQEATFSFRAIPVQCDDKQQKQITNTPANEANSSNTKSNMVISNLEKTDGVYREMNTNYNYDYRVPYYTDSNGDKASKDTPNILIDLVISTPQSDLKINRKCKSYEVSVLV
jgi:hypothetical protein